MDSLIGRRLGKYQIEALIGRGGMATVYRAHDTALNRSVAIKVLEPTLSVDQNAVERFKREAVTAANLEHPSIVRVFDVQQEGNLYYIAMRYVHGTTLRDILRDNGPLPLDAALNVVKPVASAVHYAHMRGVIHRDIKPGNILVEPDGTVLLTDFGIARAADYAQSALTATGQVMGTADYLAPEQISGRPAEARSDVYSLGVVLYEMLTGVTPFSGETTASILYRQVHDNPAPLRSINPRLPAELQPVIDRALTKNPALRYADPMDLARELEEVARWLPPGSPWLGRNRTGQATIAVNQSERGRGVGSGSSGGHAPAGVKPVTRPQTGPRPHVSQPYQTAQQSREVEIIAPSGGTERRAIVAVVATLLLLAGIAVLAAAAGISLPALGKPNQPPRFQAPGPVTYNGPLRQGNGPDLRTSRALIPPTIDGDLSDWQGVASNPVSAPYITYQAPRGRQWSGPDDLSASFTFAWDPANFYVAAVVTDNLHVQTTQTRGYNLYKGDDLEMWFDTDLAGDFARSEADGDDYQLGLSPGDFAALGPEAAFWNPNRDDERNKSVRVAARPLPSGKGYTLEAAVPWSALGGYRPSPGQAIGFAASAGDNDQPKAPIQELMTSTAPRLQYRQPFTFGNLFF